MPKPTKQELSASLNETLAPRRPRRPALASALDDGAEEQIEVRSPKTTLDGLRPPNPTERLAPSRDFNKRANSIERDDLPAGKFPGSSKKLWDAIYFRTRGAIPPRMEVKATKRQLMDWSDIRNIKTIESHLRHFLASNMITRRGDNGDATGYTYGVLLASETPSPTNTIPNHPQPSPTNTLPNQKLVLGPPQKSVLVGEGKPIENKATSTDSKTSFKTKEEKLDDEAFAGLVATLRQAGREVTGKDSSAADAANWEDVALVLATELKIAAARTTVSNVPAFLAEHLRRRLFKKDAAHSGVRRKPRLRRRKRPQSMFQRVSTAAGAGFGIRRGTKRVSQSAAMKN